MLFRSQQQGGTFPRTSKDQVERVNQSLLINPKSDGYMAPMNLWEFHARVFSLTGGGTKFGTGAGVLELQSIVMDLVITCA